MAAGVVVSIDGGFKKNQATGRTSLYINEVWVEDRVFPVQPSSLRGSFQLAMVP